jgi:hypothetical protein
MYDSYGLELCNMYDSHGIYLRVLWAICMYKFSRCYVVVFHGFSFYLPIFSKISSVSSKIRPEITTTNFGKNH